MNALVPVQQTNAEVYRASTDAAGLCREIVLKTAMEIQNRRYVRVEGWQALAIAHGCTAGARDVEAIEGGVRAIGEVRRMSDGGLIATAEGFVGADEPTWYGGEVTTKYGKKMLPKRPDYAIRAMAQTRAISRACRSAFAHVVVMIDAGLSTTPAEEVPMGGFNDDRIEPHDDDLVATAQPRKSSAQAKKDGDYEILTGGLRKCEDPDTLKAWGATHADQIGALPHKWQAEIRAEYVEKLAALKAAVRDPQNLEVPQPANGIEADWEAYLDDVLRTIGGALSPDEVEEAQRVNAVGIEAAENLINGAALRVAKIAEGRLAELMADA